MNQPKKQLNQKQPPQLPSIPKVIWNIWISDKPLEPFHQKLLDKWKEVMPDYEVREIRKQDVLEIDSPYLQTAIKEKKYINATAFLRSYYLYNFGGIYTDVDVEPVKSFDDLLEDEAFIGIEGSGLDLVGDAVMASVKGHWTHKFRLDVLNTYTGAEPAEAAVETGPAILTKELRKRGLKIDNSIQVIDGCKVYSSDYFYPYYWTTEFSPKKRTENTHAVHYWSKSWIKPMVSIIIPCYNYGKYLGECLDSVMAQTQKNIEIVVVDDGSTDTTKEVALNYPVKYIYQENKGLSAARNTGIREARADYIMCLDADDLITKDCLMACWPFAGNEIICPGGIIDKTDSYFPDSNDFSLGKFLKVNQIHCASIFPKTAWETAGGYDEAMNQGMEDWDFWIRLLANGLNVRVAGKGIFIYRPRADGMMSTTSFHREEVIKYIQNKHADLINQHQENTLRTIKTPRIIAGVCEYHGTRTCIHI